MKRVMFAVVVSMFVGSGVAFATGASNNCNGNGSCSQDENIDNHSSVGNVSATGGSATAFGGSATGGAGGDAVAYGGQGGKGGNGGDSYVDNDVSNKNTNDNTVVGVNESSNTNKNSNSQGQEQGQSQTAKSTQNQSASNTGVNTNVSVAGSTTKVRSYAVGLAAAPAAMGTDSISVGSIFGGIGFSQTSIYTKTDNLITRLIQAHEAGVITEEEFKTSYRKAMKRLENTSKRNDRGLGNVFGLL